MQRLVLYPISFICGFCPEFRYVWMTSHSQISVEMEWWALVCSVSVASLLMRASKTFDMAESNSSVILWSFKVQYSFIFLDSLLSFRAGDYVTYGREWDHVHLVWRTTLICSGFWPPTVAMTSLENSSPKVKIPPLRWIQEVTCTLSRCDVNLDLSLLKKLHKGNLERVKLCLCEDLHTGLLALKSNSPIEPR